MPAPRTPASRPPAFHAPLVPLPRLQARLDAAARHRLVVVSAPAGYGKTAALARWWAAARRERRRISWLTVDDRCADPEGFWAELGDAVRVDAARDGRTAPPRLHSTGDPVGALLAVLAQAPQVLVVDDAHRLDDEVVADLVRLVEGLPAGARLVLAGRSAPPLPLPRWRLEGRVDEMSPEDLRLDDAEVRAVAAGLGLELPEPELDALARRTEGWLGGLRLAALQRARGGAAADDRFARDYLAEEVLAPLPADVGEFLVATSVLETLAAERCAAVAVRPDAGAVLDRLARGGAFVTAGADGTYRAHPVFRGLLRERLAARPDRERAAHCRAAAWSEAHGETGPALDHALAAGDLAWAARIVDDAAPAALRRGATATVAGWLDKLPPASWQERPTLFLRRAAAAVQRADVGAVAEALGEAERRLLPDGASRGPDGAAGADDLGPGSPPDPVRTELLVLRAFLAAVRGETERAVELSGRALPALAVTDPAARAGVLLSLGRAHAVAEQSAAAERAFADAVAISRATADGATLLTAASGLARSQATAGRLHDAATTLRRALREADDLADGGGGARGNLHASLGEVLYEWNELDDAEHHQSRAAELGRAAGLASTELFGLVGLALVRQARGDADGADAALERALDVVTRTGMPPRTLGIVAAYRLRLLVARDDPLGLARWQRTADPERLDPLTRARWHVAALEPQLAVPVLAGLAERARERGSLGAELSARALQAVALLRTGEEDAATDVLREALVDAEPEGYLRTFLDEGAALGTPLRRLRAERGPASRHASRLLGASTAAPGPSAAGLLTPREQEILQLLDEGLSNRDIGRRLYLSAGTVKTHLYKAYAKLGVRSRLAAVATARALDLL